MSPMRSTNGYRTFRESDLHKLTFLSRARSLGFTIDDCRALLELYVTTSRASADVKKIASEHLVRIDAKIEELIAMKKTLSHLVHECAGDNRPECPILDDLAAPSKPTAMASR